ncbi:uncharacterized protein E0L32_010280 [Thyridium curvatum]|uniref:Uncharacterized protein n=1 Tax=Thyridium curvatum TaxID=1093900 RepID=A0A507AV23_9PEZI|nr:uncharacterized protein E0L32_010280 [Thyridium curvatum]TPX08080.1 hypothetical protein E0L32_010280 [Thyridium curvatum]
MPVQQHILNWLYSVLTSVCPSLFAECRIVIVKLLLTLCSLSLPRQEYHDVNRTYNDVAQALSQYPSLSPRTDVHTFPNGASALLLHLSGTIPVLFRGTTYRFPVSLWIPHAYPREAPLVYVTPTETMMVRPGQHVDPQGQVYHPYLVGWAEFWDKSSLLDFIAILRDIFAKEPPVISRQGARSTTPAQQQPQQQVASPPPVPPLPPDMAPPHTAASTHSPAPDPSRPPPPPPKPHEHPAQGQQTGPPLPPHPGRPASQYGAGMPPQQQQTPPRQSRYDSAPPLPPQELPTGAYQQTTRPPPPPQVADPRYQSPPPAQYPYQQGPPPPQQPPYTSPDPRRISSFPPPTQYNSPPPQQQWQQAQQPPPHAFQSQPQPHPKPPPPPDIMDEPLTLSIPSPSSAAVPAPPIPPNPEKDALLHQLAQTLHSMREHSRQQNESSLAGLQAQRTAMLNALAAMQAEASGLTQLSALVQANTSALHEALRRADGVIEDSARRPAPGIDELLVAPTVVANQLYDLVAEERALADAVFVLGRAVERGRVSPAVFAKMTRSLAREWYLKKALVRKVGRGMGLAAW